MANCKGDCWKCHWCWLGRCMGTAHYGEDISVVAKQPKECEDWISKDDWAKQYHPMKLDRAKELINAFINNLSVAESNQTVIKYLLYIGFTKDELVHEFNYCEDDVVDAEQGMDDYVNTLTFC